MTPAPSAPAATPAAPAAPAAPKAADGETSASQVVGGAWTKPKGPSPDDEKVVAEWKANGKLFLLEGVWCAVPYKVTVVNGDGIDGAEASAKQILDDVAKQAEQTFSHFIDNSEVSTINKLAANVAHDPSPAMKQVLSVASSINRMTRGAFDPAILPLTKHYKSNSSPASPDLVACSKWSCFQISENGVMKTNGSAMMDLCGLAKGWAIDQMSLKLKEAGFTASYVDWGGDIKVSGQHPTGRNWTAAVLEPYALQGNVPQAAGNPEHIAHIELRDGQAIATSGDYLQTLQAGMSHILDPKKGSPMMISQESVASASVVTDSCMLADALATASMAVPSVKDARLLLDNFRTGDLKDPVMDYLLYSRLGPRVVRMKPLGAEDPSHREVRHENHHTAHVVIVGGGLAGISAAIEAVGAKATVTLLEKEKDLGGNSAKATSGINACNTRIQKGYGVNDDSRWLERDTFVSAKGGTSDLGCVSMLASKSAEAIHWLIDELGIPLTELSQLGGHAKKRTHRCPPKADGTPVPVGYTIMQHARAAAQAIPGVEVKTSCTMKKLGTPQNISAFKLSLKAF